MALLGPNGLGKSTMIKITAGIFENFSGDIKIDDTPCRDIDKTKRTKMIGYVPHYFRSIPFASVLDTVFVECRPYMSWSVSDKDLALVDKSLEILNFLAVSGREYLLHLLWPQAPPSSFSTT